MKIEEQMTKLLPFMVHHRRELHKIPELLYQEFKTSEYLQKALTELGYGFKRVDTGLVVNIKGTAPKRTVGFRADMDGLEIKEATGVSYKSQHPGRMHACGHDGHMAMLLGFAKYLKENPPKDNVVLVFQPAEEGGLGAKVMIDSGFVDADVFYAVHLMPWIEVGKFASRAGEMLAGAESFDVEFLGRGRHCMFHDGKDDAILAAARFINDAEGLNSERFIFNIGAISGGTIMNAVAEKVVVKGTMRFFSLDDLNAAYKVLKGVIDDIEKQGIGKVKIVPTEKRYLPLINTPSEVEKLAKIEGFIEDKKVFGAEDFSLFLDKFGGVFINLGCKIKDGQTLHSDKFNFDENAMVVGVQLYKTLLG